MKSSQKTIADYIASLPLDRQEAIVNVRDVIVSNLPDGYEETMNWGMITYEVPLAKKPDTYNKKPLMYAGLASQKNHMAVYLSTVYTSEETAQSFKERYKKTGKKLDMGKSCVRFKTLEQLPLKLIGETIAATQIDDFIALYETNRS